MISIIVAASSNMVIGKDNKLLWDLPTDLKYFKSVTLGKTVFMGRKTWESIPEKYRPLPNRTNIVLTRDKDYKSFGSVVLNDLKTALKIYCIINLECVVIGGSEIYKETFKYASKLYLTEIDGEVQGDTYLEGFNPDEWVLKSVSEDMEENGFHLLCSYVA